MRLDRWSCLSVLCSYTAKFDKVKLDKIVENVSELPDPEVNSKSISFSKRNSLHFLFYLFSDLYGLLFLVQMLLQTFHFLAFALLQLDATVKEAFDVAYNNIYAFHLAQKSVEKSVETMKVCQY
jgi:histidinol dehydrogenase